MAPGPVEVVNPAEFDLGPLPATAELPATPEEEEFERLAAELERDVTELSNADVDGWTKELEQLREDAEEGIYHDPLAVDEAELADATAAAEEAAGQIQDAYGEIPGEAWQNLPAPYTPPPEEGGFIEVPDPARVPAPGVPTPTPTPPPGPITATVALENVTRGGYAQFFVGDGWTLNIRGPELQTVVCSGSHNGTPFGPASFGLTDNWGRFDLAGQMTEAELGLWVERWYVGGQLCSPVLEFEVS
jgi:hypothetical protein